MQEPSRIFDLISYQSKKFSNLDMFSHKIENEWIGFSTDQIAEEVDRISLGLMGLGIKKGDKVGVVSENRLEWSLFDFAIQQIGAVMVAVYPNISTNDYSYIFNHAAINYCFVSTDSLYQKILSIAEELPQLQKVFTFEPYSLIPHFEEIFQEIKNTKEELQARKDAVTTDDIATLIYTSGTTGKPKGVMLTHKNLLADMMSSEYSFPVSAYQRALTFLPVCHAYERLFHYVYMYKGLTIFFAGSMETIGADMKEVKPHIFSAVPRVLEKVYEKIMATGNQLTGVKRKLFFWALSVGEQFDFDKKDFTYKIKLAIARKLIFSKWREALGGDIKGVASGSATLQQKLIRLYWAAGIPIFEGYGLTEASPCLSVNCFKRGLKMGTVGVPLINIEIKLAEDGEILAKGDNIMKGYYKDEEATAEIIKDGWLHTGDIGQWIDGKYLKIVDRKKEIFKTSGGKYIVPQQIESKLVEHPMIEQAIVVGENEKFPAAFIVPNYEQVKVWALSHGMSVQNVSREEFLLSNEVKKQLEKVVDEINSQFGNFERIKKIAVLANEMTVETGELTPTLKPKRKVILEKFKKDYDSIYN